MKKILRSLLAAACLVLVAAPALAEGKPATLAARVVNADKKPVRGATVVIKSPAGDKVAEAITDKKGEFKVKIEGEGGDYIVAINAEGSAPFENSLKLEPGKEQRVEISLLSAEEGRKNLAIKAYNEAANAFKTQDWATAKAKFQEAIDINPELAEPRLGLADIALTEGNTQEAITQIEAFRKLRPDDEQGKRVAYTAYLRAGNQAEAKKISAELGDAKLNAGLAIDLYNQGAIASQKSDLATALAKFKEAAELDPNLAEAWAGMAAVLYNQSKFAEALENAEKSLTIKPNLTQGIRSRFLALDGLGKKAEAAAAWEAYAATDKKGALDLLTRRAETDFKDGNAQAAELALQKVLALDPDNAQANLQIGLIYSGSDTAKAKAHLQKFLAVAPEHPEAETAKEILAYLK